MDYYAEKSNSHRMVEILQEHGADPNKLYLKHTLWEYSLHYAHTRGDGFQSLPWPETQDEWQEIFKLMLQYGVDPDVCCLDDCNAWSEVCCGWENNKYEYWRSDDIAKYLERATRHRAIISGNFR
jgi:hypothetical protein